MTAADMLAFAAVAAAVLIPTVAGLWKLATMLAEVRTTVRAELQHNGGGSTKDYAKRAANEVADIRVGVEYANHRIDELQRQGALLRDEMDASRRERSHIDGRRDAEMAALAHDVRTVRTSQTLLADHIEQINARLDRLEGTHRDTAPPT